MTRAPVRPREGRAAPDVRGQRRSAQFRIDGAAASALDTAKSRLVVAALLFAASFLAVAARLVDVGLMSAEAQGVRPRAASEVATPRRADILDRNGMLLATSLPTASLYANPHTVLSPAEAASKLARALPGARRDELLAKLTGERSFVWLRRHLTPTERAEVHRLGLPGIEFQREQRRVYPHGALVAHVVGFTGVDDDGLAGIEQALDDRLRQGGAAVETSLDLRLQMILREELAAQVAKFRALGGAGVILDLRSGEVLAMVSLPDFDPNEPGDAVADARFSRASLGIYELGSVFKVFTHALALDSGTASLASGYDATHPLKIGRFTISDFHPERRWLTVPEIFAVSSNIGAARMAREVGGEAQKRFLERLGLLAPANIELPEVGLPMFPARWRDINTATIAFGHGVAVSPLQFAAAVAAVVNGGMLRAPTLIKQRGIAPPAGARVISAATSDEMRRLFRYVVTNGTGKQAAVKGYVVGGKTGTAEKLEHGRYKPNALLSSFVGAFPMNAPRYLVFAVLDEPKGIKETHGFATGGWTAAPLVGRIIARAAPLLGIAPQNEAAPELVRALAIDPDKAGTRLAAF